MSVRDQPRAQMVLLADEGLSQAEIAEKVKSSRNPVGKWCRRFAGKRLGGLSDAAGRGRKPRLRAAALKMALEKVGTPPGHLELS